MKQAGQDEPAFDQLIRETAAAATVWPAPADAWERIATRVRAGEVVLLPVEAPRGSAAFALRGVRAAAILLAAGAAAAAAVLPASPLRRWLEDVLTPTNATVVVEPHEAQPTVPAPAVETTLVLEPANGGIIVALEAPERAVTLRVRFTDAGELEVRATGAAANAQFRSAVGRLTIANATGGELTLTIPRATSRVRVEVDGQAYLTKQERRIQVLAPAADTAGSEILLQIRR